MTQASSLKKAISKVKRFFGSSNPPRTDPVIEQKVNRLQELRAEVQDLQSLLESVRKGESTLALHLDYLAKTKADIGRLLRQIKEEDDSTTHLHNCWEQMLENPIFKHPAKTFGAQDQLHYLDQLESQISKIVFQIAYLTVPSRVDDWLRQSEPGCYLPFHQVFDDELPSEKDRSTVLNRLAWAPRCIQGGIVDPVNGLIYRYSDNIWARLGSIALIVAWFAVLTIFTFLSYSFITGQRLPFEWNWQDVYALFVGGSPIIDKWLALLAGILAHIAIGTVKRSQTNGGLPPVFPLGRIAKYLNAKAWQIVYKMLLAFIGLLGLVFATPGGVDKVTIMSAFLVGYSLDSVIEIFGTSVEKQAAAIKKQLVPANT